VDHADTNLESLKSLAIDGAGLRVDFEWCDDRYGHEIALVPGPGEQALLVAEVQSGPEDWPDSPPLQQISWMEAKPGKRIGLLVGMAGKSHWSVSVESDSREAALLFDVACRVHHAPQWLGNKYRCPYPIQLESPHAAQFAAGDSVVRVMTEPTDGEPPAAIAAAGTSLSIQPAFGDASVPRTVRWKYRIAITRQTKQHEH
jgi:hypothetical protein